MSSAWRPFVPDQAVRALLERPSEIPVGVVTRVDAVVLFTDIAGFTAMSEALARVGRRGAEELSRILNSYFHVMIDRAVEYGGTVASITGDAMTVLFPCDHLPAPAIARRAVQSALDMQTAMARFGAVDTEVGTFVLAMRAGLAAGPVLGAIVGDPAVRVEYVVTGRTTDRAAAMEQRATTGQVVVDGSVLDASGQIDAIDVDGEAHLVKAIQRPPVPDTVAPDAVDMVTTSRLEPFLHPAIAERLRVGRHELVNEHRKVTVAFVSFPDLSEDDPDPVAGMQAYLSAAVRVIDRYGGHLNQVDTGDKGNMLMLCFGTPVAYEDDEERAVRCCLELLRLPGGPFRAGVTTGRVFCGVVGSDHRRYYTVVGLSVNLAARLLQVAQPGQVVIDAATFEQVEDSAISERLRPVQVKGKRGAMTAWAVQSTRDGRGLRLLDPPAVGPLVGRDAELRTIGAVTERAHAGHGQVLSLSGPAGIGKSRLMAQAVAAAERLGFHVTGGACQSYGTATAYLVWRPILRDLLGVDPDSAPDEQRAQLLDRMATYGPDWVERAPLLAPVLGLTLPDSRLTRSLDPRTRAELLQSLVTALISQRAADGPLVLVLEDCHWIDQSSSALLEMVARDAADLPALVAVATRSGISGRSPIAPLAELPHHTAIELQDLSTAVTEQLAATRLRARYGKGVEPPDAVIRRVAERAGGNPFHVEELIAFLHERGVDLTDPRRFAALELPDSLHRLVLARLDQLSEGEKATVKVASVIGRVFRPEWLWGCYPEIGRPEEVARHLEHLDVLDLTPRRAAAPEAEYGFKHAIIQEVAYDSLTFGMRQTLHEAVGGFIERTYAGRLEQYVDMLAFHYGRTRNEHKQRMWFRAAGTAAKASYANDAAVEHFERLLPLLEPDRAADVLLELGDVWHLVGRWTDAEDAYRRALRIAGRRGDRALLAAGKRHLGMLLMRTTSYSAGVDWLTEAAEELERLGDRGGLAAALDRLAFAAIQQGAYADATAAAGRHLAIATEAGDQRELSGALNNLGLVAWDAGRRDEALELMDQALAAATAAGDERGRARIASDLAALHLERGAHGEAVRHLREAVSIALRIGDQWIVALCVGNASELYLLRGDHTRATRYCAHALDLAMRLGDWVHTTFGVVRLAAIAVATGEGSRAEELFDRAASLARSLGDSFTLHECLHEHAKLLADTGRLEEAERMNHEVLDATAEADAHTWMQAELLSERLHVALGRLEPDVAVARLRALADTYTENSEQAAIFDTIVQIDPGQEAARARAASLYLACYEQAPTVAWRDAYARLTGVELPAGPPLPPLLESVEHARTEVDVTTLLAKVDAAQTLHTSRTQPAVVGEPERHVTRSGT